MHKELLCSVSDYFTAALKGNFKEAAEHRIEFPEEKPWIFERFQLWLYFKQVLDEGETPSNLSFYRLKALYIFAECRSIPRLQNHVVDLMIQKSALDKSITTPGVSTVTVYSTWARSFPLRRLLVDLVVYYGSFNQSWRWEDESKDYLVDLIRGFGVVQNEKKPKDLWKHRCDYHIHADCEPRCSGGSSKD